MTKLTINIGTADKGDGDPLRVAFNKVNENFTEIYGLLGLDDNSLNLGAFEFTDSVMSTTDSTPIIIDQATTVTSNLTVGGDLLPSVANGGDLGSLARPWKSLYVSNSTIYLGGTALSIDGIGNLLVGGQAIADVGTAAWDNITGKPTIPTSFDRIVNGAHTVSLSSAGLTAFPAISNESLFIQASELGSANASIGISAKNSVIVTANILETAKQWTFGTNGTLTVPNPFPTTFTAVLDNAHRTVGNAISGTPWQYTVAFVVGPGGAVETQINNPDWPTNPGYSLGDEFEFTEEDHGIPGFLFAVTINGFSEIPGTGFLVVIGVTPPPEYPSTVGSLGAIKLSANTSDWVFDPNGSLHYPDGSFSSTAFVGDATRLYGNLDQNVDVIARSTPATVTATTTAGTDPFIGQFEISLGLDAVQAGWEMNTGTEQSPIWTTVTNASLNPGEYWIYLASGFEFQFSLSTAYTFRNPALLPKTWTFDTNGLLTFPNGSLTMGHGMGDAITSTSSLSIYAEGGLGLSCDPTGPNLSQINLGDQGNINIRSLTASGEKYWYFNSDGTLTGPGGKLSLPPNGKITSGVGAQIGYQAVIATDLYGNTTTGEVGGSTVVNVGSNAQLLALIDPASEFGGSQYNLLSPITITYSDNTTQTFSSVRSTNIVTGSVIVFGSNSDTTAGHNFPITLETANYAPAYTAPEWTFGIDGSLTFPNGALQRDTGSITCPGNASTLVYTTSSASNQHTMKLLIQVEGFVGAAAQFDTQACEMIIAKSFRADAIAASVYGVVHTSVAPLAIFTADWNPLTSKVEVLCTTPSANSVDVKIFATEITTSD